MERISLELNFPFLSSFCADKFLKSNSNQCNAVVFLCLAACINFSKLFLAVR